MKRNKYLDKMIRISEVLELKKRKCNLLEKLYDELIKYISVVSESHLFSSIKNLYHNSTQNPYMIISNFCTKTGTTIDFLSKKTRKRAIVKYRQQLHTILCDNTKLTLAAIGQETGGQNHATVLHSHKTVDNLMDTDRIYRNEFLLMVDSLNLKYFKYNK